MTTLTPQITPAEAQEIAQEAYVFGLPLVYSAIGIDVATHVSQPEGMLAPLNQFAHLRDFPDAAANPIVGMNLDTLYSFANLDLTQEPLVLTVPEMGDRYWIMQLIDLWNDVPAAPGARTVDGEGGRFAIVGPQWQGTLPEGITEIRADTTLVTIGGRTYVAGPEDVPAVHAIQDQYTLTPLSLWGTAYAPPAEAPVKPGVDTTTPTPKQTFALPAETYFTRISELLVGNPAREADAPVMARMARLGITPGGTFSLDAFPDDVPAAIEAGVLAGQQQILDGEATMGEMVNGWQLARDLGRYGTKYPYRATWTYFAIGGNLIEDAFYPMTLVDGSGEHLDGAHRYTLHFAPEELPPVDAFWSLTMYDPDSYLVPNAINRYALGDRSPMTYEPDGSLTIVIQHDAPAPDQEANWLPTPEAGFKLALRLYRPQDRVIDGRWAPPAVQRVD